MYRQSEKSSLNSNISSTCPKYGELRPISGWDRFVSLRHPSKFQRVSRLGFVSAATSVNGSQPNFAHIHFGGSCPVTEFCQVHNSLCVLVLRSPILAALLHGTRVVGVTRTLRRWAEAATYIRRAAITLGIGLNSSCLLLCVCLRNNSKFLADSSKIWEIGRSWTRIG